MNMKEIFIILLNLSLVFSDQAINGSVSMKSLSCYNDYSSQVTCKWKEHIEAHALLGMTLYQRDSVQNESKEMLCKRETESALPETSDPYILWVCQKTVGYFGIGIKDIYSFKPNKILETQLNVHLFQNVQPLPPQNLSVRESSGDFLLTWTAAEGSQGLGNALEYEVTYKRVWESWEKAASRLLSNTTRCHLSHLVPGSRYVARVRARAEQARGFSGPFSEWSTDVSWETPEGRERIQPRNLRCLFNGANLLTCSWEVKKVITTSVIFGLFFRATPASAEEECSPVYEKALPHIPYVVQSCAIPVSNISSQSRYHVSVRTKTEEKLIEAYKNIKVLPPANVSVKATENQEYELRWIKHTFQYNFIKQKYQVQYWKHNQYDEAPQILNISNDEPPFIFTLQMLSPSTKYRGKMRARVNSLDYQSSWSEWSEEFSWETENVLSPVLLPVMLPVLIITLLIIASYSYKYFLRQKKLWEEKIPNPSKSLLIQSYLEKVHLGNWLTNSQLDFKYNLPEKMDQPSFLQVVDRQMKTSAESPEGQAGKTEVSPTALDLQNPYHALNVTERAPVVCLSRTAGRSFSVSRRNSADASTASQTAITSFAFNGPYLYSPVTSSQPEMHQPLDVTPNPVGNQEKSVSLQYVTLPNEVCPQAPRRQEQPGAGPQQPFLLPDQKETMQHLNDEKEVSPLPPAGGQGTNVKAEEQKSPKALGCAPSLQQCPSEYIATDSLLLPSASDSTHPPLATAGELPCDSQEPQLPSDRSCHEFAPGKSGVTVPVSGQAPIFFPESHLNAFGDYLVVPSGLHGPSEPTKISLPVLQKGSTLPNELPLSEGNLVVLNPDSTEPVFLCQVGDYCFHSLKSSEKVHMSQEDPQVKKPNEARTAPGKPLSDHESNTGKKEDVSKMQAIQLFKSLKSDDYFSWQQSLRIREIC
ncbi:cytokine receptor common subunit beta-like [Cygnus olor]|uniref:cytokine receptor common subunit beta-like n=1 Tax=Cygnus olor TaxID=8869 RepID=UPI001ADE4541|nr:cytokine receptor common subunit beta-like [Cygnus olor]XP_040400727.1 cytokine receptor common subunit beta-like [Cygnus olor]